MPFDIISAVGGLTVGGIGAGAKYLLDQYKDEVKKVRDADDVIRRYVEPLVMAANDLERRLDQLLNDGGYSKEFSKQRVENLLADPANLIFKRDYYTLISTCCRLACFIAWSHLFTRDLVFFKNEHSTDEIDLQNKLVDTLDWVCNGDKNPKVELEYVIFSEEIRAIGEFMLPNPEAQTVIGYHAFLERMRMAPENLLYATWLKRLSRFFECYSDDLDRRKRLECLQAGCKTVTRFLDKRRGRASLSSGATIKALISGNTAERSTMPHGLPYLVEHIESVEQAEMPQNYLA